MDFHGDCLRRQAKRGGIAEFHVGNKTPSEYLKWISYIPEHWHVDEILKKDKEELTVEELNILERRKIEKKQEGIFKNYLETDKKDAMDVLRVYEYMEAISIDTYAELKLTLNEMNFCLNMIGNYGCFSIDRLREEIFYLEQKDNRSMVDEYILYKLNLMVMEREIQPMRLGKKSRRRFPWSKLNFGTKN